MLVCVRLGFNLIFEATRIGADLMSIQFCNPLESAVAIAIYLSMVGSGVRLMPVYPCEHLRCSGASPVYNSPWARWLFWCTLKKTTTLCYLIDLSNTKKMSSFGLKGQAEGCFVSEGSRQPQLELKKGAD